MAVNDTNDAVEDVKDKVEDVAEAVTPPVVHSADEASPVHHENERVVGLLETIVDKLDAVLEHVPGATAGAAAVEEMTDGDPVVTPEGVPWTQRKIFG